MASNDKEKSVATELTAGSDSAATEHTEEPQLAELVNQEADLATEIELKVIRNDLVDYTYPFNGQQVPTQKVQIVLQSKVADQYCLGVAKLQRKNKTELKQVQDCFEEMASQAASLGFLDSDGTYMTRTLEMKPLVPATMALLNSTATEHATCYRTCYIVVSVIKNVVTSQSSSKTKTTLGGCVAQLGNIDSYQCRVSCLFPKQRRQSR
jgi:hypothetical protein